MPYMARSTRGRMTLRGRGGLRRRLEEALNIVAAPRAAGTPHALSQFVAFVASASDESRAHLYYTFDGDEVVIMPSGEHVASAVLSSVSDRFTQEAIHADRVPYTCRYAPLSRVADGRLLPLVAGHSSRRAPRGGVPARLPVFEPRVRRSLLRTVNDSLAVPRPSATRQDRPDEAAENGRETSWRRAGKSCANRVRNSTSVKGSFCRLSMLGRTGQRERLGISAPTPFLSRSS